MYRCQKNVNDLRWCIRNWQEFSSHKFGPKDRGTKRGWTELFAIPKVRCEDVGSWVYPFKVNWKLGNFHHPPKTNMEAEN